MLRTFRQQPDLGADGALGLVFEIVRDGKTVGRTTGWWNNDDTERLSEPLRWEWGGFDLEDMRARPEVDWELRVTGSPELALLSFDARSPMDGDAKRAWIGEATIPLRLADPWHGARPLRTYVPTPVWKWNWLPSTRKR